MRIIAVALVTWWMCIASAMAAVTVTGAPNIQVLTPSGGGTGGDYAQIQAALNNSPTTPLILTGGTFDVCQELLVPERGVVVMWNSLAYDPYRGAHANAKITCSGNFNGSAYIGLAGPDSYAYLQGIAIDDNYQHQMVFTGWSSGSTLTVTS